MGRCHTKDQQQQAVVIVTPTEQTVAAINDSRRSSPAIRKGNRMTLKLCRDHDGGTEPCGETRCKWHLWRDATGYLSPDAMPQTCALRVADAAKAVGGMTQPEVAELLGVSTQRVDQIEKRAFAKLRRRFRAQELAALFASQRQEPSTLYPPTPGDGDAGSPGREKSFDGFAHKTLRPRHAAPSLQMNLLEPNAAPEGQDLQCDTLDGATKTMRAQIRELIRLTRRLDAIEARARQECKEAAEATQPTEAGTPCLKAS